MQPPLIGVVTWNSLRDLERYFGSCAGVAASLGAQVIIIDNASSDASVAYLRDMMARHPHISVHVAARNAGYAAAVNRIFARADGRDVLLLNADVELSHAQDVVRLAEFARHAPNIGVVAPRLLNSDGSTQNSARSFPSLIAMAGRASILRYLPSARAAAARYARSPPVQFPTPVDWAIGGALLVRWDAFEAVGGWDEHFFLYLEDVDFCLRCRAAGYETWYVPDVALRHMHRRASDPARGSLLRSRARRAHVASTLRFFRKHPELMRRRADADGKRTSVRAASPEERETTG